MLQGEGEAFLFVGGWEGEGAFACSGEIGSADVKVETGSLGLQGQGEDFLFVGGWEGGGEVVVSGGLEGGGEVVISASSSECRRLLPDSSQMSMKSPFGLDVEEAWVSIASCETW